MRVLGIDPGFACVGWAIVELVADAPLSLVSMGVWRTEKAEKRRKVLASDDNFRRARELARCLGGLAVSERVEMICAESMSFPRSSSVAAKMAMCWGAMAHLSEVMSLPVAMATPKEVKRAVTGNAAASKDEVKAAIEKRFGVELVTSLVASVPKSFQEHPFDAVAAIVACEHGDVLRMARRMPAQAG